MIKYLFFALIFILAGCNSAPAPNDAMATDPQVKEVTAEEVSSEVDLKTSLSAVIKTTEELKAILENSPNDTNKIKAQGKALEEKWDLIEKQVEARYPKDYKNIEASLYPLIAFAKKDKHEINKMKQLVEDVTVKLVSFKEKVSR